MQSHSRFRDGVVFISVEERNGVEAGTIVVDHAFYAAEFGGVDEIPEIES